MKKDIIESFEIITLRESGMRFTSEYELIMRENDVEVSRYEIRYSQKGDERNLIDRAVIEKDVALKLLNDCKIIKWNGFFGAHPRGVKDGIMFNFTAVVNGGTKITASGSQNFPKRYRDFTEGLYNILKNPT